MNEKPEILQRRRQTLERLRSGTTMLSWEFLSSETSELMVAAIRPPSKYGREFYLAAGPKDQGQSESKELGAKISPEGEITSVFTTISKRVGLSNPEDDKCPIPDGSESEQAAAAATVDRILTAIETSGTQIPNVVDVSLGL